MQFEFQQPLVGSSLRDNPNDSCVKETSTRLAIKAKG